MTTGLQALLQAVLCNLTQSYIASYLIASFDNTKSNASIAPPLNTSSAQPTENISTSVRSDDKKLSANTSSAQATENILTAPSAKEIIIHHLLLPQITQSITIHHLLPRLKIMTLQIARKVQKKVLPLVNLSQKINLHLRR